MMTKTKLRRTKQLTKKMAKTKRKRKKKKRSKTARLGEARPIT